MKHYYQCDMRIMEIVASLRSLLEIVTVRFSYDLRQLRFGAYSVKASNTVPNQVYGKRTGLVTI